MNVPWL